ncbi:MAG: NUDIX hydrolase [Flavobacteriales bacterium]|nr:NUDIX hydrolase [Flavobacteriales bacterium]
MKKNELHKTNPNVSVDSVILGFDFNQLNVLLINRDSHQNEEDKILALPGNLIYDNEDLDMAANRVLRELTGIKDIYLDQIGAFGNPDRISKKSDRKWLESIRAHPDARVITIAYYTLVKMEDFVPQPSSFAKSAIWVPLNKVEELAFDHSEILESAVARLRKKIIIHPIGFNLLPNKFTLSQLQKLYESILGRVLDKRNFRRKVLKLAILTQLKEKETGVTHKPASYYKFNKVKYEALVKTGFDNFAF